MSNPTVKSEVTYVCFGCGRGFKTPKLERKFHRNLCGYFLDGNDSAKYYRQFSEDGWASYLGRDPDIDWSGDPQFYKKTSVDGKDVNQMRAKEVATYRKRGIAS